MCSNARDRAHSLGYGSYRSTCGLPLGLRPPQTQHSSLCCPFLMKGGQRVADGAPPASSGCAGPPSPLLSPPCARELRVPSPCVFMLFAPAFDENTALRMSSCLSTQRKRRVLDTGASVRLPADRITRAEGSPAEAAVPAAGLCPPEVQQYWAGGSSVVTDLPRMQPCSTATCPSQCCGSAGWSRLQAPQGAVDRLCHMKARVWEGS